MVFSVRKLAIFSGAVALAAFLTPTAASGVLSASAAKTKILVVKRLDTATRDGRTVSVPAAPLQRWNASLLDENVNYLVLEVPSENASRLRDDLLASAQAAEIREDFDTLKFRAFPVDARAAAETYPAAYMRTAPVPAPARDAFVLQFSAIPRPEWLDALKRNGATLIDYIPENGYTVLASSTALSAATAQLPVQLLRLHQPVHKISEAARNTTDAFLDVAVSILNVPEAADAIAFLNSIKLADVRQPDTAGDRSYFRVTVATSGLPQLAALPAVVWIETLPLGLPSGEREAHLIAGDDALVTSPSGILQPSNPTTYRNWLKTKGFIPLLGNEPTYASMKVALLDTGFGDGSATGHDDFYNSSGAPFVTVVNYTSNDPTGSNADCYGHGTMVAGVMGGNAGAPMSSAIRDESGAGYWMGTGVAPGIGLVAGRVFNYLTGSPSPNFSPQPWVTIYTDLANRGVAITNNSWNDLTTAYTTDSEILDKVVRSANGQNGGPSMSILFSAGNRESTPTNQANVTAPATAKNVIAVGGSENYNPNTYPDEIGGTAGIAADNGNHIWSGSRIGPTTLDSRIKPDVVAPGTGIESPRTISTAFDTSSCKLLPVGSTIDPSSTPQQRHVWSRGTSFSSPGAAGAGALLHKWFQDRTGGLTPRPSLSKAMQATLAYDVPTVAAPPGNEQGFGKVDLKNAFQTDGRYYWNNEANTLTPASPNYSAYGFTVKDATKPVKLTLVWTDAPGTANVSPALKNDLDLMVESTQYAFYCAGNNKNATTRRSKVFSSVAPPYPTWNRKDNVEQCILLPSEFGSTFNVHVRGISIGNDAINVWSPSTAQQDFALFIENVVGQ